MKGGENNMNKKEKKKNRKEIIELLQETERPGIEKLVSWLDHSNFFTSPASTMFHGNYEGGLAAHSYEVYQEFKQRGSERLNSGGVSR